MPRIFYLLLRGCVAGALLLLSTQEARAQDVLLRGVVNGVRPPDWMLEELTRDSTAFEFRRAFKSILEGAKIRRVRYDLQGVDADSFPAARAAQLGTSVTGVLKVPVFPVLFRNTSAAPYANSQLQRRLFSAGGDTLTLSRYYREMSRRTFQLTGTVYDWTRLTRDDTAYQGLQNGRPPYLGRLLKEVLDEVDSNVDFRAYDRDGDGFVDVVAFVQPEIGGECGGNRRIWSQRWTYGSATGTKLPYQTKDGVKISDFVIQPAKECNDSTPINIGVFAHELGHALGLPDLYSTTQPAEVNGGLGYWSLMSHGSWNTTASPAYMDAWSKAELGWLPVRTLTQDSTALRVLPSESNGIAWRINLDKSRGEYLLLENRQPIGADIHLLGSGLLVWHIDSAWIATHRSYNTIQNTTSHLGVRLLQADGRDDLDSPSGLSDDGDPFPGASNVTRIDATTRPSTNGYDGGASPVVISNIRTSGDEVTLDVAGFTVVASGATSPSAPAFVPLMRTDTVRRAPPRDTSRSAGGTLKTDSVSTRDSSTYGPLALIKFRGAIRAADTTWLRRNGFVLRDVFGSHQTVLANIPAQLGEDVRKVNNRIVSLDVQMLSTGVAMQLQRPLKVLKDSPSKQPY